MSSDKNVTQSPAAPESWTWSCNNRYGANYVNRQNWMVDHVANPGCNKAIIWGWPMPTIELWFWDGLWQMNQIYSSAGLSMDGITGITQIIGDQFSKEQLILSSNVALPKQMLQICSFQFQDFSFWVWFWGKERVPNLIFSQAGLKKENNATRLTHGSEKKKTYSHKLVGLNINNTDWRWSCPLFES